MGKINASDPTQRYADQIYQMSSVPTTLSLKQKYYAHTNVPPLPPILIRVSLRPIMIRVRVLPIVICVPCVYRLPPHPAFHKTPTKSFAVEIASAASPTMPIPSSSSSSPIIPPRSRGIARVEFVGIGIAGTEARR
jgi:hypothetical protein